MAVTRVILEASSLLAGPEQLRLEKLAFFSYLYAYGISQHKLGEGNGNLLQCSCLESPRDGGAWWAAVYGVTQGRTRLK